MTDGPLIDLPMADFLMVAVKTAMFVLAFLGVFIAAGLLTYIGVVWLARRFDLS